MTRDDVIRMAREAGVINPSPYTAPWQHEQLALECFAYLVIAEFLARIGQYVTNDASREAALEQARAEEREACVTLADRLWAKGPGVVTAAIRARGEKP